MKTASSTWNVLFTHTDCSPSPPPLIPLSPNMGTTIFPVKVCNILLSVPMSPSRLCFGCLAWVEGGCMKKGIIFSLLSTGIGGINGAWFFSCDWYQFFSPVGGDMFLNFRGVQPPLPPPPLPMCDWPTPLRCGQWAIKNLSFSFAAKTNLGGASRGDYEVKGGGSIKKQEQTLVKDLQHSRLDRKLILKSIGG